MNKILISIIIFNYVNCFAQKDTVILYTTGEPHYHGAIDDGVKSGMWHEFNILGDTLAKIQVFNECKVIPHTSDSNVIEYYFGTFKNDSIVKNGLSLLEYRNLNESITRIYLNNMCTWQHTSFRFKNSNRSTIDDTIIINQYIYFGGQDFSQVRLISNTKGKFLHGFHLKYDDSNYVEEVGNFFEGAKTGDWQYYKNGILICKGKYFPDYFWLKEIEQGTLDVVNKDGIRAEKIYPQAVLDTFCIKDQILYIKNGKWEYFSDEGVLVKEEFYEKGLLLKIIEY